MSLETRVEKLEQHHKQMDTCVHGLARTCADIKNIALTNQHDITTVKSDISNLSTNLKALTDATHAGFKRADEQHNDFVKETREHFEQFENRFDQVETRFDQLETRFDQLELLIRQSLVNN